jgi:integrase/recombinase XerD
LGDPLVDRYLAFVAGRARAETLRAAAFDLKMFFTVVSKSPVDVVAADVFDFLAHQRGDRSVIRITDRESGLAARTIARRRSDTVSEGEGVAQRGLQQRHRSRRSCVVAGRVAYSAADPAVTA